MQTDDRRPQFRRSLAGVVLAGVLLALWGVATPGSLPFGSTEPVIDSVTPESAAEGTVVTILGANFGPSVGAVQGTSGVSFNGVWSTPTSWSASAITVPVPPGAATGPVVVTVSGEASSGVEFDVTGTGGSGPAIGTVSPMLGLEGTVVTIRGENFGSMAEMGGVSFNGVWASATSWSEEEIRVAVPADAGSGPVVVTANGQASNGVAFIVPDSGLGEPAVHSLSSGSGPEGTVVTIEGENFGPSIGALEGRSGVSFNGVWGEPTSWSETQIQVAVPKGAPSGVVTVAVGGEGSNGLAFVVERPAPLIEAVDSSFGPEGTRVEISGRNFGPAMEASQGWSGVSFDGLWGMPTYWSDREIHVSAPAGGSGGLIVVTSVGQESNGIPFTVARSKRMPRAVAAASTGPRAAPVITKLKPATGAVEDDVKIKGSNFGDERDDSTVTFNGTEVRVYDSWGDAKIDVEVPGEATTGPVVVTVGGVVSNGVTFTVTGSESSAPTISSLEPDSGPEGTSVEITGTNFGASQGTSTVTFNGAGATPTNWSDTSITVAVPMGATTGEVVVTVDGTASSGVSFTVAPAIGSLSPDSGPEGTTVEITGTSFGAMQGTSTVTFNGTGATPTGWSDTSITVAVPMGAATGDVVVTVDGTASDGVSFAVTPAIGSLSPIAGPEGATVEITGTSFGAIQGTSTVAFNGTGATPTGWSDTSITVTVPVGATTGNVVVTVGGQASNGVSFAVGTDPVISGLNPDSGPAGTTVEITGANFGASQGTSTVTFNGAGATPANWSDTSITVAVPANATTGNVVVTVDGASSNGMTFSVKPVIGGLSRVAGPEGATVVITGTGFGPSQGTSTVTFNRAGATPTNWSDTSITVTVPAGAATGSVMVTVGGTVSDGVTFTVTPAIGSLSPIAGPEGAPVVITGTSFGAMQGTSTVAFNGTGATPTSWSGTSITVTVPTGATTGPVVVTVAGQASNGVSFTVGTDPIVTSLSPGLGRVETTVVIGGANFGASQGTGTVTFNGVAATATSWSDSAITVTVPATAATGPVVVTVAGVASNQVTFTVTGPPPVINKLKPGGGEVGDSVKVKGEHFGTARGTSKVTFNGEPAISRKWDDDKITVNVPAGARTGPVVVTVEGQASNPVTFSVTGSSPSIISLDPTSGEVGTSVTIAGVHFGATQGTSTVTFNGVAATASSWSDASITVPVPATAATGPVVVTVGGEASNQVTFTVTVPAPSITGLEPTSGRTGASVTITGTNFGDSQGTGTVTFNGVAATPSSWSGTSITVAVPATAATGNVVVTVGGQASNPMAFTVVSVPAISSLNPGKVPEGTPVTIAGANFGDSQGTSTVTFNGVAATPTSWSDTSITAAVPAGATTGNVVVTVGGEASDGVEFAVTPAISGLNPTSGPEGTSVEITGTGFGATQGTSSVSFNGTAATPTSWSGTSITVTVPAGAATGNVVVTVDSQASNGVVFTVTPAISSVSPDSGAEGTSVDISGTNFGATQGASTVTFNGTAATPTSWSGTSIAVTVPAGATTGPVVVTVDGQASNGVTFTVTPSISGLNPSGGPVAASVEISGTNFGDSQGVSTVTFNGTAVAAYTSWSNTSITVTVPAGATTGDVVVTVGGQASNGVAFTVKPSISGLNPDLGPVGASVEISGTNFGDSQRTSTVTFNGVTATASSWDDTSIAVTVPAGATTGNVVVTVDGQASNGVAFTVKPSISGLNPSGGPVETSVEITGTSFGDSQGTSTVTFNGTAVAAYTSWSDTSITVEVPAGGATGSVVVTVGGQASNGVTFTVTPAISALNPTSGPEGTTVEITGTSFGPTQGTGTVTFNGTAATPTSWSDTSITVAVPAGATTGDVVVTVGGQASNGVAFTVKPAISGLNPDSGPVGASVEISGTNFGDSQRTSTVTFNGVTATASSWDDTSIAVTVPAGATTGNVVVTVDGQASNGVAFTVKPSISGLNPSGGPVETSVVISGATFGATQGPSTVTFNGTAVATYSSWSDTSITVEVPAGATTGNVVVTVGGQASNGVTFTVTENRAPEVVKRIEAQTVSKGESAEVTVSSYFSDPDEDDLEYTVASADTAKVTVAVSGAVVTVTGVAQGSATVTVTASDGSLTAQQGFTATVPNRAPEALGTIAAQMVNKGSNAPVTVSGNFRDPDMDNLSYSASSSDTSKVSVSVSGAVVTVSGVSQGSATVTVTASDGSLTAQQGFTVTVPNRAPEALGTIAAQMVNKGSNAPVTVSGNFRDPDMDTLTYSASSSDTSKVSVSVTGAVVTVAGVAQGSATVTVTASDGHGGTAQLTFGVTVPNRAPVKVGSVSGQTVNKNARKGVSVSGKFSDADGDRLDYSARSDSSDVSVTVSGSTVTIEGESQGGATVTVTASDGHGGSDELDFGVTVPNRAPVRVGSVSAQSVYKNARKDVSVSGKFSDADGDGLDYSARSSDTSKVTVSVSGSTVTIEGESQTTTPVTVTVRASDRHGGSDELDFGVTVPNRAPVKVGAISDKEVYKGNTIQVSVSGKFRDLDGDDLTYSASSDSSDVSVRMNGLVALVTGVSQGSATVTVTARDPHNATARQSFDVDVPNRDPEAVGMIDDKEVYKGNTIQVSVSGKFRDLDGDDLTYSASSDSSDVSVRMNGLVALVTGVSQGSATVTVTARDPHNATARQSFDVDVPNRDPEAVGMIDDKEVYKGNTIQVSVSGKFRDLDGDDLTYSASSDSSDVSVPMNGAVVMVTGVSQGSATVTVTARDPHNATARQSFDVDVPNRDPEAVGMIDDKEVYKGNTIQVSVSGKFRDLDGDDLTYSASSDSSDVSVPMNGAVVMVTGESQGSARVTVTAEDPHNATATQSFDVDVPNRPPPPCSPSIPSQSVYKGDEEDLDLSDHFSDPDEDTLTYSASSSDPAKVTVSVSGSTLTMTGESQGSARVTVTANDGNGGTRTCSFSVTVPNRAPEAVGTIPAQTVNKGSSKQVTVSGYFSDPDMDTLTYSASSSALSKATASVSGATLTITGVAEGTATVTVTAEDDHGGDVDQEFDVTVTVPTPSTPSITSISPSLQRPDDPVTIYGNHFGSTAGSVSFGGHSISIFSGQGYSWSNTSISLLIPGSLYAGPVSVSVTTNGGSTSNSYSYTVTGGPVSRGDCEEEGEDCPGDDKPKKDGSGGGDSEESEDPPGDGG